MIRSRQQTLRMVGALGEIACVLAALAWAGVRGWVRRRRE
jgi:hypothetical protein